jgi:hypothetical protein
VKSATLVMNSIMDKADRWMAFLGEIKLMYVYSCCVSALKNIILRKMVHAYCLIITIIIILVIIQKACITLNLIQERGL